VYLDVWERHLTYIEDDLIREVALGGPDTATRAKIMWQVKLKQLTVEPVPDFKENYRLFLIELGKEKKPGTGSLSARAKKTEESKEPCLMAPEARYRGAENQLYRVEIHKSGVAWNGKKEIDGGNQVTAATFKWSRENGSVIFPIRQLAGTEAIVEHLGRDNRSGLCEKDWVEVIDDDHVLRGEAGPLAQVASVDRMEMKVTFSESPNLTYDQTTANKHPLLRRWDHKSAAMCVSEGNPTRDNDWISLENGIQILFHKPTGGQVSEYRVGDYWLIPARTATGDVEWPGPVGSPAALPPHGVVHHYAPLAIITVANGAITDPTDLRRTLKQLWS
jgi:hypothetical protein